MTSSNSFSAAPVLAPRKRSWVHAGILLVVGLTASTAFSVATDRNPSPCRPALAMTAADISQRLAAKNAERSQHLLSFEGKRHYSLEYAGFPSVLGAQMNVNAAYRAPGLKKLTIVSESGSKLILNHALHRLLQSEEESSEDDSNRNAVAVTPEN